MILSDRARTCNALHLAGPPSPTPCREPRRRAGARLPCGHARSVRHCAMTTYCALARKSAASTSKASCPASSAESISPAAWASRSAVSSSPSQSPRKRTRRSRTGSGCMSISASRRRRSNHRGSCRTPGSGGSRPRAVQPLEPARRGRGGLGHLAGEERARGLHRGELELLLGAEVGEQAALAHPDAVGQPADRESLDALDGGESCRLVEDRLPAARLPRAGTAPPAPAPRHRLSHSSLQSSTNVRILVPSARTIVLITGARRGPRRATHELRSERHEHDLGRHARPRPHRAGLRARPRTAPSRATTRPAPSTTASSTAGRR